MRSKPLTSWIYTLQHTLQQSNTCMLLGWGCGRWETRARANARGCAHVSSFSVSECQDWFLHYFAKRWQETWKTEKSKREASSPNTYFSLKKTKFKEIKWDTELLDFSAMAGSGRVQVVQHHHLIALSEAVLGISAGVHVSSSNSHPSCIFLLKLIRLCSHCFFLFHLLIKILTN